MFVLLTGLLAWMLACAHTLSRACSNLCLSHKCRRRGNGQDDGSRFSLYNLCLPQSAIAIVSMSLHPRGAPVSASDAVARLYEQENQRD